MIAMTAQASGAPINHAITAATMMTRATDTKIATTAPAITTAMTGHGIGMTIVTIDPMAVTVAAIGHGIMIAMIAPAIVTTMTIVHVIATVAGRIHPVRRMAIVPTTGMTATPVRMMTAIMIAATPLISKSR